MLCGYIVSSLHIFYADIFVLKDKYYRETKVFGCCNAGFPILSVLVSVYEA